MVLTLMWIFPDSSEFWREHPGGDPAEEGPEGQHEGGLSCAGS